MPDPGVPMYTVAPVRETETEAPTQALFDRTRLTRRAWSKGSQEKNKYAQRPLLTSRHAPPHTR